MTERRVKNLRASILFDEIDLLIIQRLNHFENGLGVLELAEWFGVMHNNLKPHIDKLLSLGLIYIKQDNSKKAILLAKKDKEQKIFLDYLINSNMYLFDKKQDKKMGIDLRTKEARKFIKHI